MRKIKSIRAVNFQSHKDTIVEVSEGVTSCIGNSEQGKSTLFTKAIEWLVNGTVLGVKNIGNEVNSDWIQKKTKSGKTTLTEETSVEITFNDGIAVKRIMDKNGTAYYVTYPDERKDLELTGNNGKVPDVVQELFNFNDLNLSNQFERIFLLHETPVEIAKTLNKVCDMELPSKVLKEIKSDIRKNKSRQELLAEDISKLQDNLEEFTNLDIMEEELFNLETLYKNSATTEVTYQDMERLFTTITTVLEELKAYSNIEEKQKDVQSLLTLFASSDSIRDRLRTMESCLMDLDYLSDEINKIGNLDDKIKESNELLLLIKHLNEKRTILSGMQSKLEEAKNIKEELNSLKSEVYIKELNDLLVLSDRQSNLEKTYTAMKNAVESAKTVSASLKQCVEQLAVYEEQLHEELKDGCPLCGK